MKQAAAAILDDLLRHRMGVRKRRGEGGRLVRTSDGCAFSAQRLSGRLAGLPPA
jgi:hypothetical protein